MSNSMRPIYLIHARYGPTNNFTLFIVILATQPILYPISCIITIYCFPAQESSFSVYLLISCRRFPRYAYLVSHRRFFSTVLTDSRARP